MNEREFCISYLKKCATLKEFLSFIRSRPDLSLRHDNGWFWVEHDGEEIEGSGKERFTSAHEIDVLLELAGLK